MKYIAEVSLRRKTERGTRNSPVIWSKIAETCLRSHPVSGSSLPTICVTVYPKKRLNDDEGDQCCIAYFSIERAEVNLLWFPTIVVVGDMSELKVSDYVEVHKNGESKYTPSPDPSWSPSLVELEIQPKSIIK